MQALTFAQIQPNSTGEKIWLHQQDDGTGNVVDIQHVTLGADYVLQKAATLTVPGQQVLYVGANNEIDVIIGVSGAVSGAGASMTVSVQDVDPADLVTPTVIDQAVSGAPISATGAKQRLAHNSNSGFVLVKWAITGATPSFGGVNISTASKTTSFVQPTAGAITSVPGAGASTTLLAANSGRKGCTLFNDSTSWAYVNAVGGTASNVVFSFKLAPGQPYEFPQPIWPGAITAIWDTATGAMRVTEYT